MRLRQLTLLVGSTTAVACAHDVTAPSSTANGSACAISGTLQLAVAQAARVDCSNGGTTFTLAGNGASYLIVPQLAVSLVPNSPVAFRLSASASASADVAQNILGLQQPIGFASSNNLGVMPPTGAAQRSLDAALRRAAAARIASGAWTRPALGHAIQSRRDISREVAVPSLGSTRSFRVIANATGTSFSTATARLVFAGTNLLLYVDTLAPSGGFTPDQLQAFGVLFDQTLYPIDTAAFGPPTDIDGNGHVIMLMSPAVNALTKASDCQTNGFIAGFFDELDLGGAPTDTNSNQGEIFYSVVPDPAGTVSCAHSVSNLGLTVLRRSCTSCST